MRDWGLVFLLTAVLFGLTTAVLEAAGRWGIAVGAAALVVSVVAGALFLRGFGAWYARHRVTRSVPGSRTPN
jgi:hypothetical protein